MSPTLLVGCAFAALFVLILARVPIGIAMMITGAGGFALQVGVAPALSVFASEVTTSFGSADLAVVPVFLLMGNFASAAGLSADLYRFSDAFVGHRRGGLALATLGGCAGFGALCGSSLATVGTMTKVAYPEMLARGYAPHFSAGTIAVGGTLGILVPPSIIMVLYAVLTETFVIDLYLGAVIPAIVAVLMYGAAVSIFCRLNPAAAPPGPRRTLAQRLRETRRAWGVVALVLLVMGGIYAGVFTALEAASVGAVASFVFMVARGRFTWPGFIAMVADTATTTGMIFIMVIGASVFNYFMTISQFPQQMIQLVEAASLPPTLVIASILVLYIVLGAVFDEVATMLITLPFVMPLILSWGYDPVWWGIVNVTVIMIGLYCPPIGLNVMVMHGLVGNVPLNRIYRGILPYLVADLLRLALLVALPVLVSWLPQTMR
ncbi:MAG: TRAP transporter large permease [Lautropia sp.]